MKQEPIAIIGLELERGRCRDVDAFARRLYNSQRCDASGSAGVPGVPARVLASALADAHLPPGQPVQVLTTERGCFAALDEARRRLAAGTPEVALLAHDESGAAVVVLRPLAEAEPRGNRIYAVLEGLTLTPQVEPPTTRAVAELWRQGVVEGDLHPQEIGYVEIGGAESKALLTGLARAYPPGAPEPSCALGRSPAFAASPLCQLTALIKAVLCLHHRFLPGHPPGEKTGLEQGAQPPPFYVDEASRPWFVVGEQRRRAALLGWDERGQGGLLLLADYPRARRSMRYLQHAGCYLLPLGAADEAALLGALEALQPRLAASRTPAELRALARACYTRYQQQTNAPHTLVLVGRDGETLLRDLDFALAGVPRAFREGKAWSTPRGSYFTPRQLAQEGGVAFVYPGAFNSYPNLGRELFQLFPALHERFAGVIPDLGGALGERMLYPRALQPLTREDWQAQEAAVMGEPGLLIESGTSFAILFTAILREHFAVRPAAAFGYSLGEASMLWAAGIWQDGEAGSRAWRDSPLFKRRLSGPKEALREAWGTPEEPRWRSYLLKAPIATIREALREEPRVYLTMINTPREGVIGGHAAGCERVIAALKCHALPVPYDAVLHAEVMRSELPALAELYTHPVRERPDCTFYSAAEAAPLELESATLAHTVAEMTCRQLDFPRLVEQVYADGARLFIELGPQRTCTRWIDEILGDRPYAAMAIDKKGTPSVVSLFGVLARLLSHGVPLALDALYVEEGGAAPPALEVIPDASPEKSHAEPVPALSYAGASGTSEYREHGAFLRSRRAALRKTGAAIRGQIVAYERWLRGPAPAEPAARILQPVQPAPRFDRTAIEEFATGSAVRVFGPAYAVFAGRRMPRIPNGDLLLMSRIREIEGDGNGNREGATLVSEYDVPEEAWFFRQNGYPTTPYAVYVEMALQPCGFLSAYLGSALSHAEHDLYFRNLDGTGRLLITPDLRGRTVTDHVRLLSTLAVKDAILQRFAFSLACEGETFYEGEATFGYFERRALLNQQGLDGSGRVHPWYREVPGSRVEMLALRKGGMRPRYHAAPPHRPHYRLAEGQLDFLETARVIESGGRYGRGYVHAEMRIRPEDWFFACHFYEDPVMPGSLGLEGMQQALQVYALRTQLGAQLRSPCFLPAVGPTTVWKYRGQVTPQDTDVQLEVHVREVTVESDRVTLTGDASLWKGDRRIYEVSEMGLRVQEATREKGM